MRMTTQQLRSAYTRCAYLRDKTNTVTKYSMYYEISTYWLRSI